MPWVLIASGGALVIQIRAPGRRQAEVGFADAPLDLLKQCFAQLQLLAELLFQVGIFRLEVIKHLSAVAVFQPAIRVGSVVDAGDGCVVHGVTPLGWRPTAGAPKQAKAVIISATSPVGC